MHKHIRLDAATPSVSIPHTLGGPLTLTKVFATTNSESPITLQVMDGSEESGLQHYVSQDGPLDWTGNLVLPWDGGNSANLANDVIVSAGGLPSGTGVVFVDLEYGIV